jgi:hypothetical protein
MFINLIDGEKKKIKKKRKEKTVLFIIFIIFRVADSILINLTCIDKHN